MTLLYILLAILLLLTFLCFIRIHLVIIANTDIQAVLKILFIKIPLYPKSKKKIRPERFKKGYPSRKDQKKKASPKKEAKKSGAKKTPLGEIVSTVLELVKLLFSRFTRHLRLDVSKIVVTVGGEDAAKCAIQYGIISQSVAYLLAFLDNNLKISKKRDGEINVLCDFTAENTTYDVHISASLTVWQLLDIGISLAYNYFKTDVFHLLKS